MKTGRIKRVLSIGLVLALTFSGNVSVYATSETDVVADDAIMTEEESVEELIDEDMDSSTLDIEETEECVENLPEEAVSEITEAKNEKIEFTEEMISAIPVQVYTSFPITPKVSVCYGKGYLVENEDFIVSYSNNINVGKAKAVISGVGKYKGSVPITVFFNIVKRDVNSLSINGIVDEEGNTIEYYYTGSEIRPVRVFCYNEKGDRRDVTEELKIQYSSNTDAGDVNVSILGSGNFYGCRSVGFTIQEVNLNDPAIKIDYVVNNKMTVSYNYIHDEVKPELSIYNVLSGKRIGLKENRDYLVEYSSNVLPGTAKIVLSGKGNYFGERVVSFNIEKKRLEDLNISYKNYEYTGEKIEPSVEIRDGEHVLRNTLDYNIVFENNKDVGNGIIRISAPTNSAYTGNIERTFTISRKDLSKAVLEKVSNFTHVYGSNPVYVQDSMVVKLDGKILTKDEDYSLSYTNNKASTTQDVTATVKVTGINNYTGSLSATYTISPFGGSSVSGKKRLDDFNDKNWDVSLLTNGLSAQEIIYDGKEKRPAVVVKYMGKVLEENVDYTLTYYNNTDIGTAHVLIKAMKDSKYVGSRKEYFYIIGRPINGEGTVEGGFSVKFPTEVTYSGKMCEPEVSIKYLGKGLKEGRDYQVTYYNNGAVTDNARVVIKGIGDYSKSLTFTFAILPLDLSKVYNDKVLDRVYTGTDICPPVLLKTGKKKTDNNISSSDYNLEYRDNRDVGTATIICTPANPNITGSKEITFKIRKKKLKDLHINSDIKGIRKYYIAEGDVIQPDLIVSYNGLEVVQMGSDTNDGLSDVMISYGKNLFPGKGTVIIKATPRKNGGTDNFTGSKKISFTIVGRDFVVDDTIPQLSVPFVQGKIKPSIETLRIIDKKTGEELVENTDYKVKYQNTVPGQNYGEILFIGKGIYKTKEVVYRYKIVPISVDQSNLVIGEIKDQKFSGMGLKPAFSVKVNDKNLKKGIDYVATYKNNRKPGIATVEIFFIGNYEGSADVSFNIIA